MFMGNSTHATWEKLKKAHKKGDRGAFAAALVENFADLKRWRDELRLLFYVGKEFDEESYRTLLALLADWKHIDSSDKRYRCQCLLYAYGHTMPPNVRLAKPYLVPLFLEATNHKLVNGNMPTEPPVPPPDSPSAFMVKEPEIKTHLPEAKKMPGTRPGIV